MYNEMLSIVIYGCNNSL